MKKLTAILVICLWVISSQAQIFKASTGKKIQTLSVISLTTTVNQMGTEMVIPTTANVNIDFEMKSATSKEIKLTSTLKRITGDISVMGNEQKYDSNDSSAATNPMAAELLKDLNKPKDLTIVVGKPAITNDITGAQSGEGIANGLFIPVDASVKEGFTWSDSSSSSEGSKMVNTYMINKVSKEEVIVKVITKTTLITTRQQMGMEVKVNMQGITEGIRVYDVSTGLLKSANNTFTSSGNNEVMGNSIPVSVKGTAHVTVR